MVPVSDVVSYILSKQGPMESLRLHLLCYYVQAWHLVWTEHPLFWDTIVARPIGPVVSTLYVDTKNDYLVSQMEGIPLPKDVERIVDAVWAIYGHLTQQQLIESVQAELPWMDAYTRSGDPLISDESLLFYYGSLSGEDTTILG